MNWALPGAIQIAIDLFVLAIMTLAGIGKLRDGRFKEQKELIELRGENIKTLEDKVDALQADLVTTAKRLKDHADLAEASEASLRAEIAQLMGLNLKLQKQVDTHAIGCPPRKKRV